MHYGTSEARLPAEPPTEQSEVLDREMQVTSTIYVQLGASGRSGCEYLLDGLDSAGSVEAVLTDDDGWKERAEDVLKNHPDVFARVVIDLLTGRDPLRKVNDEK